MAPKNTTPQTDTKKKTTEETAIDEIKDIVKKLTAKITQSQSVDGPPTQESIDWSKKEDPESLIQRLKRNISLLEKDVGKVRELNNEVADEVERQIFPLARLLKKVEDQAAAATAAAAAAELANANATDKPTKATDKPIKAADKLTKGMKKDVEDINKKIFKLMCDVPLLPNKRRKPGGKNADDEDVDNNGKGVFCLHGIHTNDEDLKTRAVFRYVKDELEKLKETPLLQICLLSFGVFPENQEVNRTMLMYWWIGENILPEIKDNDIKKILKDFIRETLPDEETPPGQGILPDNAEPKKAVKDRPEDVVKAILDYFVDRNLIEAVENKRKVEPNCYKMNPFVHSSLALISKEIGLFDVYRKGDKPRMTESRLQKVCLVEGSSSQAEAKANKMKAAAIETVFNVSERFPDFTFKWFSEEQDKKSVFRIRLKDIVYEKLKVFYLGRWERTAKRHIEIENPEHMKYLKHMIKLRLLSFQGISRIERLDDAVCKLHELIILDLRACYNLEKLPDKINLLRELVYLDITDCYMIDRMPKRLSWLAKLEVLKGFVVSDAQDDTVCKLAELKELKNLRKLSITINKGKYSVKQLFIDIKDFEKLEKLKVAWGGINEHNKKEETGEGIIARAATLLRIDTAVPKETAKQENPVLPKSLRKLDLQCFPDPELPTWLQPSKLLTLEKLYIKGGMELTGFGKSLPEEPTKCNVKVLRLKFLPRLKVEWRDLKELYFPNLKFLDKYQCPQVSLCPCDGIGIWRSP